jgi:hypothetical protein
MIPDITAIAVPRQPQSLSLPHLGHHLPVSGNSELSPGGGTTSPGGGGGNGLSGVGSGGNISRKAAI